MTRTLSFTSSDALKYRLLWEGFVIGATVERQKLAQDQQRGQKEQGRDDRRSEARIKRLLSEAGTPIGEAPAAAEDGALSFDRRLRKLKDGGAEVALEQGDFTRLQRYIAQTPWVVEVVEHSSELEDWLEAAPKVSETATAAEA